MTEQSQMPLVGPPKRRGWREIVWFRPLTSFPHATLVVTRRGRLTSVVPASSSRALSDYLAWPYNFREVDMRERLLALDQRLESFDSGHEFCVSLRLVYQVTRAELVAIEIEDAQAELAHAVVQSLRTSGRSFGVEQDKTFEEHLQETLVYGEALVQRVQSLGLALRRADVTVTLDEHTRAHAEALRSAMRERPLHFQIAVESLEPDRSFDVHVGGAYRLTERRAQDGPSEATESAIQMAVARTLRRVGITFAPSDYPNAAKAMVETLRRDALLQSELSMVQAQLLRPTVQIQPDRSMVHVPRPNPLGVPDTRPDPMLRRLRHGLPRAGRPPALVDMSESEQSTQLPPADAASQTLPLDELPAASNAIEGAYTLWPRAESLPTMRALPSPDHPDDEQDARAPWADLINAADAAPQDIPWLDTPPPVRLSEPVEPLPWESAETAGGDQTFAETEQAPTTPMRLSEPVEPLPWESAETAGAEQSSIETEQAPYWPNYPIAAPTFLGEPAEPLPWESASLGGGDQQLSGAPSEPEDTTTLNWSTMAVAPESDIAADPPTFSANDLAGDLGSSLDWSDPAAEQFLSAPIPGADMGANDGIAMAHWDDQDAGLPGPLLFNAAPADYASASPVIVDLDLPPAFDSEPTPHSEAASVASSQPEVEEEQEQAQPEVEQEEPPWYTPILHLDDQLPFDAIAEDARGSTDETLATAELPQAGVPVADTAADTSEPPPVEALDTAWAAEVEQSQVSAPSADTAAAASEQPSVEALDVALAESPALLNHTARVREFSELGEHPAAHVEGAAEIPTDLVARMIGMIQSYGPAWFKMWSLELKERPERLPVVLGEVTADPVLLAQADDPRVQSALLLALAVYSAPAAFPARALAPLPSPAVAGQSDDAEDEVPDWLSLRVKWNGQGGGA